MSDDEPNDDELEREHNSPMLASRGARPRLSAESRAINLEEARQEAVMPSEERREREGIQRRQPPPTAADTAVRRSPLGRQPAPPVPIPTLANAEAQHRRSLEAIAWDGYASAALALCIDQPDPEGAAAVVADNLLAERRRRFG